MKKCLPLAFCLFAAPLLACEAPVCRVDPDTLALPRIITFDEVQGSFGPGRKIDGLLALSGAVFGEHFAGQTVTTMGTFDTIDGAAFHPLTLMPGRGGQNLSVVMETGNAFLNGYGATGFPRRNAQGEGAIAVMFDHDQSALAFDLRGGDAGRARVHFLRRDGGLIAAIDISPTGEFTVGFLRKGGLSDIAGIVVTNTDPEGMAIDTLRFGKPPNLS